MINAKKIISKGRLPKKECRADRREQVPFRMAKENVELMNECGPQHSRTGTAIQHCQNTTHPPTH